MQKIALIYSFKPSSWVSCQKIVANLVKAYKLMDKEYDIKDFSFADGMDGFEFHKSYQGVRDFKADYIIFLDHKPHPVYYLDFLSKELKETGQKPKFIFHIYGDFTINFKEWARMDKFIVNHEVMWYVASPRQKKLIAEFIPSEQIQICPFPVDPTEFYVDSKLRELVRKKYRWEKDEFVFIFTGRLSRQKRIHQLLETFATFSKQSSVKTKLVLVGDTDKLGEPWLSKSEWEFEYFHFLQKVMDKMDSSIRNRIEFHGFKPNSELIGYYNAADCLVNISVHNDEDYGMTCAEAQACGLPAILTDWAGFSGFNLDIPNAVRYVPVRLTKEAKQIKLSKLAENLKAAVQSKKIDRNLISMKSLAWTSIANAHQILAKSIKKLYLFTVFTPIMKEAASLEHYSNKNTFKHKKKQIFNSFYLKVYRHYVGKP
jgi:glycosyltransferase involved in cell wall biosynthesis